MATKDVTNTNRQSFLLIVCVRIFMTVTGIELLIDQLQND